MKPDTETKPFEIPFELGECTTLLDRFAGIALAALIRCGATQIQKEHDVAGVEFDEPDQPWYFGQDLEWPREPAADGGGFLSGAGSTRLAFDAYAIGAAMLAVRAYLEAERKKNAGLA